MSRTRGFPKEARRRHPRSVQIGKNTMVEQKTFRAALMVLPWNNQLAFALLVFERMLPSLIAFSKDTARDASCYLKAREAMWAALRDGQHGIADRSLHETCITNVPDTEEFSHKLTSYALNAALVMNDIVEFTADGDPDHIANTSTLARDSVDLYVNSLNSSDVSTHELDRRVAAHPLMQHEMRRQEEDIKFLSGLPEHFDKETISVLRTRATNQPPMLPLARYSRESRPCLQWNAVPCVLWRCSASFGIGRGRGRSPGSGPHHSR
jgi:uncharacterized protein YjaG (DUF416 family)